MDINLLMPIGFGFGSGSDEKMRPNPHYTRNAPGWDDGLKSTMEKRRGSRLCSTSTCGWRALLLPQINRQSLYLYGSEVAVEQECVRQLQSGVFVIHPFSLMRSYYIMCMMAITFLNLIGIPVEIAFVDGNNGLVWESLNVFSDTLFLIDVALNFRMGIIAGDAEEAILDIKRIRVSYLRTWFIPDVIAAFPIGYILLFAVITNGIVSNYKVRNLILMFVRILSLIRLARVSRLVRFFNEVEKSFCIFF
uniref:Hyperpolarization activated cyclic nucleotide-gated potassium channel 5 n=1 Tax=Gouania willdenowi TaxID=441366 RepID=A0A8C5I4S8_GOUWI